MKKLFSFVTVVMLAIVFFVPIAQSEEYYTEVYEHPVNSSKGTYVTARVDVCGSSLEGNRKSIPVNIDIIEKGGTPGLHVIALNAWVDHKVISYIKKRFPDADHLLISPASAPASVCHK